MSGSGSLDGNLTENLAAFFSFSCARSNLSSSNISVPEYWQIFPTLLPTVPYMATIEALFFFMASLWNLYILIGYCMHPKLLQEPANVFFLNLSIADFLLSLFILLNFISQIQGGFLLGQSDVVRCGLCQFLGFFLVTLVTTTLHILAVLSLDRFLLLYKPVRYENYFNWKRASVVVTVIWILSVVLSILPFLGFGSYEYSIALVSCQPSWTGVSSLGVDNIYFSVLVAVEAMVPLISLLLFNIFTYRIICKSLYSRFQRHLSFSENASTTILVRRTHRDNQKRVIYLFTALLIVNTINWLPVLTILSVSAIFGGEVVPIGVFLFGWLCYLLNPVAHPIIELCFIKGLRDCLTCRDKEHNICCRSYHKRKRVTVLRFDSTVRSRPQSAVAGNGRITFQITNDLVTSPRCNGDVASSSSSSSDEDNRRPSLSEMTKKFSFPFLDEAFQLKDYTVSPRNSRMSNRRKTLPAIVSFVTVEEEEGTGVNSLDRNGPNRLSMRRQTVAVDNTTTITLAQNNRIGYRESSV